mgnify:CR=1 FL=1
MSESFGKTDILHTREFAKKILIVIPCRRPRFIGAKAGAGRPANRIHEVWCQTHVCGISQTDLCPV